MERLESQRAVVGDGFEIRRALPNRHRRMVGAWCFFDHAGPADYPAGKGITIGPHPHIGLQTFSWMIEGTILHTDSLGYRQWIKPGQVNLMTAGRGISHAEESPADAPGRFQLAQLWIALPKEESEREPSFHHYPDLPVLERGGFRITVLAGTFAGERAPAEVFSPLVGVDLACTGPARTALPLDPAFEYGVMVLEGTAQVAGESLSPGALLYFGVGRDRLAIETRWRVAPAADRRPSLRRGNPALVELRRTLSRGHGKGNERLDQGRSIRQGPGRPRRTARRARTEGPAPQGRQLKRIASATVSRTGPNYTQSIETADSRCSPTNRLAAADRMPGPHPTTCCSRASARARRSRSRCMPTARVGTSAR